MFFRLSLFLFILFSVRAFAHSPIAVGTANICAVSPKDNLYCWGWAGLDDGAAFGLGAKSGGVYGKPILISRDQKILSLVAGGDSYFSTFCALYENQKIKCWGYNRFGALGTGRKVDFIGARPGERVDQLSYIDLGTEKDGAPLRVVSLAVAQSRPVSGGAHVCAILSNQKLKCWGWNHSGQLGLGDTASRGESDDMGNNLPTVDLGADGDPVQLALGDSFTCVLLDTGKVKCFGEGPALGSGAKSAIGVAPGQMGNALKPVDLDGTAKSIAAGSNHVCAVLTDGKVKCWGENAYGVLGIEEPSTVRVGEAPGQMGKNLRVTSLAEGLEVEKVTCHRFHCCATLQTGVAKCWGDNTYGELGNGDTVDRGIQKGTMGDNLPFLDLGKLTEVKEIALGIIHACAQLSSGKIKCWGDAYGSTHVPMGDNLPNLSFPEDR